MKFLTFRFLKSSLAVGLLFASVFPLQAREGEGGDDHGSGGGGGKGGGSSRESEFVGRVQTLPAGGAVAGVWQVNGVSFLVDATTAIDQSNGSIADGSLVEVHAVKQTDGSLKASRVQDEDTRHEDFGEAEFAGIVTALPSTPGFVGTWTIGDRAVVVDANTVFDVRRAAVALGATVEIAGRVLSDGSVGAVKIQVEDTAGNETEVEDHHFTGVIESLPTSGTIGVWKVSGFSVVVSDATRIEAEGGTPTVGATIRIEGVQQPDASIVAREINFVRTAFGDDSPEVVLVGNIERLPDNKKRVGNWAVDGVTVTITPTSAFDLAAGHKGRKKAGEGDEVEIHGRRQSDGSILVTSAALKVEGQETGRHSLKYDGLVASVLPAAATRPGSIILAGGQVVHFDDSTQFANGVPVIGDTISVKATNGLGGADDARKIKVK